MGHAHLASNLLDFGMDLQEAIDAPRSIAEQGVLKLERGYPEATRRALVALGHRVVEPDHSLGGGQAIHRRRAGAPDRCVRSAQGRLRPRLLTGRASVQVEMQRIAAILEVAERSGRSGGRPARRNCRQPGSVPRHRRHRAFGVFGQKVVEGLLLLRRAPRGSRRTIRRRWKRSHRRRRQRRGKDASGAAPPDRDDISRASSASFLAPSLRKF